jgi:hypothetical protein
MLGRGVSPGAPAAWLPVSATEWMASASRDAAPVTAKPANFAIAMPRLAANAAAIAFRLSSGTEMTLFVVG